VGAISAEYVIAASDTAPVKEATIEGENGVLVDFFCSFGTRREGRSIVKRSINARKTGPGRARNNFEKLRSQVSLFASNNVVGGQVVTTSR
jgi:hypothetical protein